MSDATTMSRNEYVAAFFDNEADAEAAVARIAAEGIPRDQIRMVAGDADTGLETARTPSEPREKGFFGALGRPLHAGQRPLRLRRGPEPRRLPGVAQHDPREPRPHPRHPR